MSVSWHAVMECLFHEEKDENIYQIREILHIILSIKEMDEQMPT